jgi:hypothetical protein
MHIAWDRTTYEALVTPVSAGFAVACFSGK